MRDKKNNICILREEDEFQCPGRSEENCANCPYGCYMGPAGYFFRALIWGVFAIIIITCGIITSPLWLISGLVEKIQRA